MKRILFAMLLLFFFDTFIAHAQIPNCEALLASRGKQRSTVIENSFIQKLSTCETIDSQEFASAANSFCSRETMSSKAQASLSAVIEMIPISGSASKESHARRTYCGNSSTFNTSLFKRDFCQFGSTVVKQNQNSFDLDNTMSTEQINAFLQCIGSAENKLRCTAQRLDDVLYIYVKWTGDNPASNLRVRIGATEIQKTDTLQKGVLNIPWKYESPRGTRVIVDAEYQSTSQSCTTDVQPKPCEKPVFREGKGPVCGFVFREGRGQACGADTYMEGTGPACGVREYNLGRNVQACGQDEKVLTEPRGGCSACGGAVARQPGVVGPGSRPCEEWRQANQRACRMWYKQANECRSPNFGVATYNTCRHESFGVATYKTCRDPSFGVETENTCRDPLFGLESCLDPK